MKAMLASVFALVTLALVPTSASAAVCADFPNQAAAQQAANTTDADHDGIYCESLPCPCSTTTPVVPLPSSAAVCADFPNQAAAQQAANTIDADHDGIYCESLPCPCSTGSPGPPPTPPPPVVPPPAPSPPAVLPPSSTSAGNPSGCKRAKTVQRLVFSRSRYPNIRAHYLRAIAKGWPKVMVLNRRGADARRDRLLQGIPTKPGFDRDEYPAAVGRGKANGLSDALTRGIAPIGWMADVEYVPSSENRSHGSSLGAKLRRLCNGTRFRYAFT
jgi:hypothetical protein